MIAAYSMKDKTVALFGLGGSGIATAQAIVAGGAKVIAWDDNPESVSRARNAGIETGDLRQLNWKQFSSFVLSPGVPLTHPRPHWTVDLAKAAGVEIIGDVELFVRERKSREYEQPLHCHYRYQRQIDNHGADCAYHQDIRP